MLLNIQQLIDDAKCYAVVREMRWPDGVNCPHCGSGEIIKRGLHNQQAHRQRYECQKCTRQFDDLSGTIFEGHHQPLRVWVLCLYFMETITKRGQNFSRQFFQPQLFHLQKVITASWCDSRSGSVTAFYHRFPPVSAVAPVLLEAV